MILGVLLWLLLAAGAVVGVVTLFGGLVALARRTWRTAAIAVLGGGLVGALGGLTVLVASSLIINGSLKYVGTEAWVILPLAGFASVSLPVTLVAIAARVLGRVRARRGAAA